MTEVLDEPFGFDADAFAGGVQRLAVFEPGDARHRIAPRPAS